MASPQILHLVEIQTVEQRLSDPLTPPETIEELYRFGQLLFTELQQRSSETDKKPTSVFGWSVATLGFLLISKNRFAGREYEALAANAASVFSFLSAALSAFAIKTRMWRAPSENDWFQKDLWTHADRLKRYHLVSLLETHQAQIQGVQRKAELLGFSEIFLAITALVILGLLLVS